MPRLTTSQQATPIGDVLGFGAYDHLSADSSALLLIVLHTAPLSLCASRPICLAGSRER